MAEERDWLRAIVWTLIALWIIFALVAGLYFIANAIARPAPHPIATSIACDGPQVVTGPNWGISAISCFSR